MSKEKKGSSKVPGESVKYAENDIVLGKIKGYPAWPGKILNHEEAPPTVKRDLPSAKKATYYLVRFYPTGEYAWLFSKDLSKLQKHEIEAYISEPHRKNSELMEGYRVALDPAEWEDNWKKRVEDAAENAAAAQDDELMDEDEEEEEPEEAPAAGKKRKRESNAADKKSKKAKLEQLSKKRKSTSKKSSDTVESEDDGGAEESKAEISPVAAKPSKPTKAAKTADADDEVEDHTLLSDPEAMKVKEWRHKLQKAFLGKGGPAAAEMPSADQQLKAVEDYDGYTIEYLQFSKIGKVMRKIAGLTDVPRDEEFHFKERAGALVTRWQDQLSGSAPKTNGNSEAPAAAKNGDVEIKDEAPAVKVEASTNGASAESETAPEKEATDA